LNGPQRETPGEKESAKKKVIMHKKENKLKIIFFQAFQLGL
jgi:hypothetical protein